MRTPLYSVNYLLLLRIIIIKFHNNVVGRYEDYGDLKIIVIHVNLSTFFYFFKWSKYDEYYMQYYTYFTRIFLKLLLRYS